MVAVRSRDVFKCTCVLTWCCENVSSFVLCLRERFYVSAAVAVVCEDLGD